MIQRGGLIKAFDSSGVKASFRQSADSKAFTSYDFFMKKSILEQKKLHMLRIPRICTNDFIKELSCQPRLFNWFIQIILT